MKKTVTANLNGRVFTMDEDAYQLLDSYLGNLRIYFRKEEGSSEIIADFEARIEELLSEKLRLGYEVITLKNVEEVIAQVGQPDDFSDETHEEEKRATEQKVYQTQGKKKFYRNPDDKMFGGICSGIAAYFGWDVLVVRIIAVIFIFVTQLIIVPFYLLTWMLCPSANTAEQKLQMRGEPITVENIGKTVAAGTENKAESSNRGCLSGFLDFFVGFIKICLIGLGIIIGLPILFALFIMLIVFFALLIAFVAGLIGIGGGLAGLFAGLGGIFAGLPFVAPGSFSITINLVALIILIGLPVTALIYSIIAYFAKLKPLHKAVKWVCLIAWFIALISFLTFKTSNRFDGVTLDNINIRINGEAVEIGNGQQAETKYVLFPSVDRIVLKNQLWANLQIEQVPGDSSIIFINGDENLIEKVKYQQTNGDLILSTHNNVRLKSDNNLIIRIQTPRLKRIKSNMLGNIVINEPFQGEELEVQIEGAGRFHANDLNVGRLKVKSGGIGSTSLVGNVRYADLSLEGAGEIDAYHLRADSVVAHVDGVGSLRCDPVKYLKANMNGIGQIIYKSEPAVKDTGMVGIGKIGRGE